MGSAPWVLCSEVFNCGGSLTVTTRYASIIGRVYVGIAMDLHPGVSILTVLWDILAKEVCPILL